MKKALAILLAAALVLSFASCSKKTEEPAPAEETTEIANPVVDYASLADVNAKIGSNMIKPGAMGVTDEAYAVISDTIGQYTFNMNGAAYVCRASKTLDDITGIYVGDTTAFGQSPLVNRLWYVTTDDGLCARWFDGDMQYIIYKNCAGLADYNFDSFVTFCEQMVDESCPGQAGLYNGLAGTYTDAISGRVEVEVTAHGNYAVIEIVWSSSSSEFDSWYMSVDCVNGRYSYTDGEHLRTTYAAEGGEPTIEYIAQYMEGYFELTEEGLVWSGAAEESMVGTVFAKIA